MSRKYKFYNKEGLYFVSFAAVYWIDVFVRELYFNKLVESVSDRSYMKGIVLKERATSSHQRGEYEFYKFSTIKIGY